MRSYQKYSLGCNGDVLRKRAVCLMSVVIGTNEYGVVSHINPVGYSSGISGFLFSHILIDVYDKNIVNILVLTRWEDASRPHEATTSTAIICKSDNTAS